ncbi:MAG: EamA family transporter [Burkholderiales bacterium 35-55-47]|jgi:drug/metabolite transporter (DMT)-like permease|uniref:DMT family transporter n=1 Tax=Limnohabitans sp. TaxID=1907725 RepID=UPI000BCA098B|nr:DMT family transporter [Limnohabitans sp.]OYY19995.1 MAG: EamA family transporter [Burkholderiales bacterium 35-55-47]OYZ74395.1 MAG: EamA family transporter [Burkholderiales bacterium 24-55-52]OZB01714.1 MAG: EamA family transporter [Burkholderiales bacterium 39-55-53]HQR86216.1 DMT family transporter [Limnohabitans sp.]HQS25867.1 DMT family transporter [Limnohabitans sp.]
MTDQTLHWREWLPEFVLLALLWGSSFLFMREGAYEFGPFPTAWVRITLAALMLTPILLWRQQIPVLHAHWRPTLSSGLLNSGIPFACYAYALMHISTGLSSILNATTPLFGALIAWAWLGDRLNATRALGLALGFTGVVLLASDVPGGISFKEGGSGLAVVACLVATFCYGIAGSFTKRYLQNVPSLVTTTGSLWGASIGLAIPALLSWPSVMPSIHAWAALGIAGLLCTALAYVLYFRLMTRTGPARAMTVTYLIPVFANLLGVIFLDEVVTHWMMGCAVVIVAGTALASGLVGRK